VLNGVGIQNPERQPAPETATMPAP
jgi:hypothetical protein